MIATFFDLFFALGLFFGGLIILNSSISTYKNKPMKAKKPLTYFIIGLFSSLLTQSSSAVTSIAVQAADNKLINEKSSYFVVMGTNIGTTFVCYLIMADSEIYSLILSVIFLIASFFVMILNNNVYRKKCVTIASVLLIIISLRIISGAFLPFIDKIDPKYYDNINPIILFILTLFATAIFQSSALTATLTITLAKYGVINLEYSLLMLIAANIGTCSTAVLSSLGKSNAAKNVAIFNVIFNICGAILHINLITIGFDKLLLHISVSIDTKIALYHTIFNTTTALIFIVYFVLSGRIRRVWEGEKTILR